MCWSGASWATFLAQLCVVCGYRRYTVWASSALVDRASCLTSEFFWSHSGSSKPPPWSPWTPRQLWAVSNISVPDITFQTPVHGEIIGLTRQTQAWKEADARRPVQGALNDLGCVCSSPDLAPAIPGNLRRASPFQAPKGPYPYCGEGGV